MKNLNAVTVSIIVLASSLVLLSSELMALAETPQASQPAANQGTSQKKKPFKALIEPNATKNLGPHGGWLVKRGAKGHEEELEVQVDRATGQINVYVITLKGTKPEKMAITLLESSKTGKSIELQAIEKPVKPGPEFQGSIAKVPENFIGFEVRVGL